MKREKRKSLSTTLKRETNEEQERGRNTDWEGGKTVSVKKSVTDELIINYQGSQIGRYG